MKPVFLGLIFSFIVSHGFSQEDSAQVLPGVVVTGIQDTKLRLTSLNIHSIDLSRLESRAPLNLADALAKLPGISQVSTGNAISKPVIRGLYGNRILILLSGLRFDNQQWQDEHGLGLSQVGIDRVEVIKGPASLLYGTDAIGGVINIIEEVPVLPGTHVDVNTRFYSNSLGTLTDVGLSILKKKYWWRLRAGVEAHADYSDGDNIRVLNSRNKGYYLKAGLGFRRTHWIQNNAYNFSYNQFGFILPDIKTYLKEDGRWSRDMQGPHHNVMFNTFSSQNTFLLRSSVLKINAGIQSNMRAEDEGGGEISLDMHLLSLLENARWEKPLLKHTNLVVNQQFTFETNTNYGKRVLIPDAHMIEGNISIFVRHTKEQVVLETGLGYSFKQIKTTRTHGLDAAPFNISRPAVNAMAGLSYNPSSWVNIKGNVATGYRAANLAELSSKGIHEGTYRYEIGDPGLKAEQNIDGDITLEASRRTWSLTLSAFYNHFNNYIYLQPAGDTFSLLFPIYKYVQHDARLYGGEAGITYKPAFLANIRFQDVLSLTRGVLDNNENLPFIPAYKNNISIRYEKDYTAGVIRSVFMEPELEHNFEQNHPSLFETTTPAYTLINLYAGAGFRTGRSGIKLGLSVRNLTGRTYYDHLSRLKQYGVYNEGVNFILSLSFSPGSYSPGAPDLE